MILTRKRFVCTFLIISLLLALSVTNGSFEKMFTSGDSDKVLAETAKEKKKKAEKDLKDTNEKIDNLEFEYPPILNMITGRYDTIQNVLEMLYSMVRTDALTCAEFDALVVTCNDFDDLEMSASEFDTNSKNIIGG